MSVFRNGKRLEEIEEVQLPADDKGRKAAMQGWRTKHHTVKEDRLASTELKRIGFSFRKKKHKGKLRV